MIIRLHSLATGTINVLKELQFLCITPFSDFEMEKTLQLICISCINNWNIIHNSISKYKVFSFFKLISLWRKHKLKHFTFKILTLMLKGFLCIQSLGKLLCACLFASVIPDSCQPHGLKLTCAPLPMGFSR